MESVMETAIKQFLRQDKRKKVAFGEACIVDWFERNYRKLRFDRIVKKQWNKTPDFIALKNGKELKVEIEYLASDFLKHRHNPSEVDVVVCCCKDVELKDVKVIDLNHIFIAYSIEIYPKIDPSRFQYNSEDLRDIVKVWEKRGGKK